MRKVRLVPFLLMTVALCWYGWISAQVAPAQTLTELPKKPPAPAFSLEDIDGREYKLSDYSGKVVIVNFWATWCPPCREEMPSMQRAWKQLEAEGIVMLGIDVGEDEHTVFSFGADYGLEFPLLLDQDSGVTNKWPVVGLPTTFIVDPEGKIVYQAIGGREWDAPELLAQIRALK